jgi:Ca-activated chloride channel family protein
MWKGVALIVLALMGLVLLGAGCAHKADAPGIHAQAKPESKKPEPPKMMMEAPKPVTRAAMVAPPQPTIDMSKLMFKGGAPAPGVPTTVIYPPRPVPPSGESYKGRDENPYLRPQDAPLSTFGIDVDSASYANVRRFLGQGTLPPREAVRVEELVNYFRYQYPEPTDGTPFRVATELQSCPWNTKHLLARIGLKAKEIDTSKRPQANLVFLIDVSGSMADENKLPLLKRGMKLLAENTRDDDQISIITYAGTAGVALEGGTGKEKTRIVSVIESLQAGGSTNGESGIQMAYDLARRHFIKGGVNRVLLATDGDFNVGVSDTDTLVKMMQDEAKSGVFLSVLGFGLGNLKDDRLEALADKGNGQYAYIDTFHEARKVLLEQASGTLLTVAKDVKIQVEFNPAKVGAYRLIGYENRMLEAKDFNDDRKDAGEIGAGHTVTALYEIAPPGDPSAGPKLDPLKYQENMLDLKPAPAKATSSDELMTVKLRYKQPDKTESVRTQDVPVKVFVSGEPDKDFQFASAVAAFGMLLRKSDFAGDASMDLVIDLARQGKGEDPDGYRAEFINLAKTAKELLPAGK